jgi:hypothetical protein
MVCFENFKTLHDKVSLSKEQPTHTQTDCNDILPQTAQFYNERISTDLILVTVHEPLKMVSNTGPEHVGASVKCFNPFDAELNPIRYLLALLGPHPILHVSRIRVNVNFSAFKVYIVCVCVCVCVCMSWNIKEIIEATCTVQQWKKSIRQLKPTVHRHIYR